MIYFITDGEFVKIGYSSSPQDRINALQTASPRKLETLTIMPGDVSVEREIQAAFSDYHHMYEWYCLEGALLSFIEAIKPIFSDFSNSFGEINQTDWVFWKNKALDLEQENSELNNRLAVLNKVSGLSNDHQAVGDWRLLSDYQREQMRELTTKEIVSAYDISGSTARRWKQKVSENGYSK